MPESSSSKPWLKPVIASVVLIASLAFILHRLRPPVGDPAAKVYFYDLNTKKLYPAPASELPPLATPSGDFEGEPAGVRAMVFSCGDCSKQDDRTIGWLEKFGADFKKEHATYDQILELQPDDFKGQHLTKHPDDGKWVDLYSSDGQAIQAIPTCPDGTPARECQP